MKGFSVRFVKRDRFVGITMRVNVREITTKTYGKPDIEGILHYMKQQGNDWSSWYSAPSMKERRFRLVHNLLFYYRIGELEPMGLFVLENYNVKHERIQGIFFAFSLEFADEQQKYIFSCRKQEEANEWVEKLKVASYEYWRTQLVILQKKISMRTGREIVLPYAGNQFASERSQKQVNNSKSTFHSHLDGNASTSKFYTPISNGNLPKNTLEIDALGMSLNDVKFEEKNDQQMEDLIQF